MNKENITEDKNSRQIRTLIPKDQEGKMKPTKPIDYWLYIIIGILISLVNIWINLIVRESPIVVLHLWSYFFIIFLVVIPALIFGNFKRPRGYGFIIGYIIGGLVEIITDNVFIGGYTIFVSGTLFIVILLVFRIWRNFDKMSYG
ncbi:MAG: hypothetical protein ACTSWY_15895 [Promethearchaeota archaeon]